MLSARDLRAKAAEYRASAKRAGDDKTSELYVAVADYLDAWADQAEATEAREAKGAASRSPPVDRQTG